MSAEFQMLRKGLPLLYLISAALTSHAVGFPAYMGLPISPALAASAVFEPAQAQELIRQALATELQATQDTSHPMRFLLRKASPRLTTTKEIVETRDGDVARLLSISDQPLNNASEQQEQARLDGLLADPERQRHRKQSEDDDTARAMKIIRALPDAFLYDYAGATEGPAGTVEKFNFRPNPSFAPPNLESQILTVMSGTITIDPVEKRVVRLEGHLEQDINFGWGILGRLNKGGWIAMDQADVGDGHWHLVQFQMVMSGRVLFKNKTFDTVEVESRFAPVPVNLDYRKAIQMLREQPDTTDVGPNSPQTANAKRP